MLQSLLALQGVGGGGSDQPMLAAGYPKASDQSLAAVRAPRQRTFKSPLALRGGAGPARAAINHADLGDRALPKHSMQRS
jgi:hypothetical protein